MSQNLGKTLSAAEIFLGWYSYGNNYIPSWDAECESFLCNVPAV